MMNTSAPYRLARRQASCRHSPPGTLRIALLDIAPRLIEDLEKIAGYSKEMMSGNEEDFAQLEHSQALVRAVRQADLNDTLKGASESVDKALAGTPLPKVI